MNVIDKKLRALGLVLPAPLELPGNNRVSAVAAGNLLFVSGHGSALLEDSGIKKRGKVGIDLSQEEGYQTARAVGLKMLATLRFHLKGLDRVRRVVKITGMINAAPEFESHNKVLNGASDLLFEVFGPEIGRHARSSVGVSGLVANQAVEIEGIFEIAA